jgi:hypothetical protein
VLALLIANPFCADVSKHYFNQLIGGISRSLIPSANVKLRDKNALSAKIRPKRAKYKLRTRGRLKIISGSRNVFLASI